MTSRDSLVYEMGSGSSAPATVFLKKDWLSILSSQAGNYAGNMAVIETSQLSNSSKYMNWGEAYLTVPILLTLTGATGADNKFKPATAATSADYALSLKSNIGTLINDVTVDINGTTVVQRTNFLPLYNNFKLMTTMSWDDITNLGSTIGFYPPNAKALSYSSALDVNGIGITNNENALAFPVVSAAHNSYDVANEGLVKRQQYYNFNPAGFTSTTASDVAYSTLLSSANATSLRKSYIFNTIDSATSGTVKGVFQQAITGIIRLKDISDVFGKLPLMKGAFMRIQLGLSQCDATFATDGTDFSSISINNPLGGQVPLMIASSKASNGCATLAAQSETFIASLAVGGKVLNATQKAVSGVQDSPLAQDIELHCPAYTFNPVFENAYLQSPIKKVVYNDIYQYTIQKVAAGANMNALLSNGIANMKRLILIPQFSLAGNGGTVSQIESPFVDSCHTALCAGLANFNFVVGGSNVFYNSERYLYEQYYNQTHGTGAVNGAYIDGVSSQLFGQLDWELGFSYYVADLRQLDLEKDVPKSVSVIGTNMSGKELDMFVFAEYEQELMIDALTGSKV